MNDCVFPNDIVTGPPSHCHKQAGLNFYGGCKIKEEDDQLSSMASTNRYEKIRGLYCTRCDFLSSCTQTLTDVQEHFQVHAEREMQCFFQGMKYEKSNKALHSAISMMAEYRGRLWEMGTNIANRDWDRPSTMNEGLAIEHAASYRLWPHMLIQRLSHISMP